MAKSNLHQLWDTAETGILIAVMVISMVHPRAEH